MARGRLLRNILRQEPQRPLSPECHLAWLVAFGSGRLDGMQAAALTEALERLNRGASRGVLLLEEPREAWCAAVDRWLRGDEA